MSKAEGAAVFLAPVNGVAASSVWRCARFGVGFFSVPPFFFLARNEDSSLFPWVSRFGW